MIYSKNIYILFTLEYEHIFSTLLNFRITTKFLVNILTDEYLEKIEQIVIIRLWLKCSTLSVTQNEVIL